MANVDQITESITSLRAETSPASVTPERVGALLQAIADLIAALSNVPEENVVSVMTAVQQANSNAATALTTASAAASAAAAQAIASLLAAATAQGVVLTIKQVSHGNGSGISVALPIADAAHAGIITPAVLTDIDNAAQLAADNALGSVTVQYSSSAISLVFKNAAGATLFSKSLGLATSSRAGLFSPSEKTKLENLPSSGVVALDDANRVPAANAPQVMLRRAYPSNYDEDPLQPGDFFIDGSPYHVWYMQDAQNSIDMGVPSKNVVYCEQETNTLLRWTGSSFVPTQNDPNYAMQTAEVRRNNTTQKIYSVPNGKLATMILTTDIVNINLLPAANGASVHRLLFKPTNLGAAEEIHWPSNITWAGGTAGPDLTTIDGCDGCLVTIYDCEFAEFKYYGV